MPHDPVPEGVSAPPAPGLRERKKAATMHHVQRIALTLFEENGFDGVTIEQIAEAADVSPSTVYRYFGTKEDLVIHDEFDDRVTAGLTHFLEQGLGPWAAAEAALRLIEESHFVVEAESTRARVRLWFDTPSVRAHAYLAIDEIIDQIAAMMTETGSFDFPRARVLASAMVWPVIAALRNWYESGAVGPASDHMREAITTLRDAGIGDTPSD